VLDTVKLLNAERSADIIGIRQDLDNLREDLKEIRTQEFEHVNTPAASHGENH